METMANKIVNYLDTDRKIWNEMDRMRMILGVQILIHNFIMIGAILIAAQIAGMFLESAILLTANGMLKMTVGGVHFKKSSACVLGTGIFVTAGVLLSQRLVMELEHMIFVYIVCLGIIMTVGPQGTENNPFSKESCRKMKKKAVIIILGYMVITFVIKDSSIPYLLLIAAVFEAFSLLPLYVKNRSENSDTFYA